MIRPLRRSLPCCDPALLAIPADEAQSSTDGVKRVRLSYNSRYLSWC